MRLKTKKKFRLKLRYLVATFAILYMMALVLSLQGRAVAGNNIAALAALMGVVMAWWIGKVLSERYPEDRHQSQLVAMRLYAIMGAAAIYHVTTSVIGGVSVMTVFVPIVVVLLGAAIYASYGAHDH